LHFEIGHKARYEDEIDRPLPNDLIGDPDVAAFRVPRLWQFHDVARNATLRHSLRRHYQPAQVKDFLARPTANLMKRSNLAIIRRGVEWGNFGVPDKSELVSFAAGVQTESQVRR
jgi:hypothetical protein